MEDGTMEKVTRWTDNDLQGLTSLLVFRQYYQMFLNVIHKRSVFNCSIWIS